MIKRTIIQEFRDAKRELLELKTAQTKPAIFRLFTFDASVSSVDFNNGPRTYTIHYDGDGGESPLIFMRMGLVSAIYVKPYDKTTNTQKMRVDYSSATTFTIYSTRKITSITYDGQMPSPIWPPASQWTQVLTFNPANMGTTPGWCLQNCRLGFGIPYGTYASARADWNAQIANGTLHQEIYPPADIQVPIYIDTGTADGHVGVWDRGTFYSDGYIINDFVSYYGEANIIGWGELCDGGRVVQHV